MAVELEDPFGDDANDLPMMLYQHEFNARLTLCSSLNNPQYATPGLDPEVDQLYEGVEDDFDFETEPSFNFGLEAGRGQLTEDSHLKEGHGKVIWGVEWVQSHELAQLGVKAGNHRVQNVLSNSNSPIADRLQNWKGKGQQQGFYAGTM